MNLFKYVLNNLAEKRKTSIIIRRKLLNVACDSVVVPAKYSVTSNKNTRKQALRFAGHFLSILLLFCSPTLVSAEQLLNAVAQTSTSPAIEMSKNNNLISLSANRVDLREVLVALSEISNIPITAVDLDRKYEISISFKEKSLAEALELIRQKLPAGGLAIEYAETQSGAADEINHVYVLVKKGSAGTVSDVYETVRPIGRSAVTTGNAARLSIANDVLSSIAPNTANIKTDVVRVVEKNKPKIYLRHQMGWIEFREVVTLDRGFSEMVGSSKAKQEMTSLMRDRVSIAKLDKPIITYSLASQKLKECHPNMLVNVKKLLPPFFNNRTGIRWDAEHDILLLEAGAVVDEAANQCVRGILDLRNANITCRSMACNVY